MPSRLELRASDADRERVIADLREHAAVGRLTLDELGERTQLALVARTVADLAALDADLPRLRRSRRRLHFRLRSQLAAYVVANAALVGAWLWTNAPGGVGAGPEPFWPAWPMLGLGAGWSVFLVTRALRRPKWPRRRTLPS